MNMIHLGSLPVKNVPPKLGWISTELKKSYQGEFVDYQHKHTLINKHIELCRNDNVKMHYSHIFAPDPNAWQLACYSLQTERENAWIGCKPLSLTDAISRAQKTTVAGYIPTEMYGCATKGEFYSDLPRLEKLLSRIEAGEHVPVIWRVSDKTEIRPNEKIDSADISSRKQRTMMTSDALHYVVGLMLFGEQNDQYVSSCHDRRSWSSAGVSIFHGGWDCMARYLTKKCGHKTKLRCKDVSAMESCVRLEFQKTIYQARRANYLLANGEAKYTDRNWLALFDWWAYNVMYSLVLDMDGRLWLQVGQNPSGGLNTLYDNIDTNILIYRYHLAKCGKYFLSDVAEFIDFCYEHHVKFMGDDSIFHDTPDFVNLDQSARELGVVLTDESDGAVSLDKAVFCGFGFTYSTRYAAWLPRPPVQKLIDSLLMHRKNNSYRFEFSKLCAFKILFFPLSDHNYTWICQKISLYKRDHNLDMCSESRFDSVLPMNSLMNQELSETQIRALYLNLETLQGSLQSVPVLDTIEQILHHAETEKTESC